MYMFWLPYKAIWTTLLIFVISTLVQFTEHHGHVYLLNEWMMNESALCSFVNMHVHSHIPSVWCQKDVKKQKEKYTFKITS